MTDNTSVILLSETVHFILFFFTNRKSVDSVRAQNLSTRAPSSSFHFSLLPLPIPSLPLFNHHYRTPLPSSLPLSGIWCHHHLYVSRHLSLSLSLSPPSPYHCCHYHHPHITYSIPCSLVSGWCSFTLWFYFYLLKFLTIVWFMCYAY